MRIGICVRTWGEKGGIGVYTRSIVRKLVELDQKNDYSLFYERPAHMGTFRCYPHVREVYVPALGKLMWDQWSMPRYAEKEDVDVIFHTKFAVPLLTKCKTAMVLHGTERFVYPEFHRPGDVLFFKTVYPQYLKRASLILAVSNHARQDIIERLNIYPGRIKTVYLAADPVFQVIQDEAWLSNIRGKYKLPKRYVLFVGHIYPGKNLSRLLKALVLVRKEFDVDLVVAGEHRWKYKMDLELIPRLGLGNNVVFTSHVLHKDLVGLYNLAEMIAFPSFYESFGLPVLEAQACGCPVVASRTGGIPEAGGEAVVYIDPLDEKALANAISRVLADESLRHDLVKKGMTNARQFSWERSAQQTLHALESLVKLPGCS